MKLNNLKDLIVEISDELQILDLLRTELENVASDVTLDQDRRITADGHLLVISLRMLRLEELRRAARFVRDI